MSVNYTEQMALLSDLELVRIVINRQDYELEAARAAIKEAYKREIINKELIPNKNLQDIIDQEPIIDEGSQTESFMKKSKGCLLIIIGIVIFIMIGVACSMSKEMTGSMNITLYGLIGFIAFVVIRYFINWKKDGNNI